MDRIVIGDELSKNRRHMEILKSLLPALSRTANLWSKKIVVRELKYNIPEVSSDSEQVYVNLFLGHSVGGATLESAKSIFGYFPKENENPNGLILRYFPVMSGGQMGYYPTNQRMQFDNGFRQFFSPEGHCIARTKDKTLNILVNFSKIHPDAARDILEIILLFSMPALFPIDKSGKKGIASRIVFGSKQFFNKEKSAGKIRESIRDYIRNDFKKSLIAIEEAMISTSQKLSNLESERIKNWSKIMELEDALSALSEKVSRASDYPSQYDQIMRIEGVKDVSIEGEFLVIYTDQISVVRNEKSYDIGAYRILMDPKPKQGHQGIKFQRYAGGDYNHPHINENQVVCFGGGDFGLNSALDKLMQDFDVVPVVHLVITFLRFEDGDPRENRNKILSKPDLPKIVSDKYPDQKKSEFCDFMANAMLKILEAPMIASLEAHRSAESQMQNSYLTARSELQSLVGQAGYLKEKFESDFFSGINSGLVELEGNEKVDGVYFRRGLRIMIDDENYEWPILVWIELGRVPWVISLDHQGPGIDIFRHVFSFPATEDLFLKLLPTRNLPAIGLQVIKEIFRDNRGWFRRLLS